MPDSMHISKLEWLPWALTGLGALGLAVTSQLAIAKLPPVDPDLNILFVPPSNFTRSIAAGNDNMVADALWLSLLQYYGERFVADDRRSVNLPQMFALITDLDPQFWFAYWLGAWSMGDNKESTEALRLLEKGEAANPADHNYAYLQGFIYFLFRQDYHAAAQSFERAAKLPGADRFCRTMAARMYQKQGQDDIALDIWKRLEKAAPDASTRDIARRNVKRVEDERAGRVKRAFPVGKPKKGEPF